MAFECKYTIAGEFVKKGNLVKFYQKANPGVMREGDSFKAYAEREQDISLYVMTRWEAGKLMCRIKCPVNPLPIKGEFEIANFTALRRFLESIGWKYVRPHYAFIFK